MEKKGFWTGRGWGLSLALTGTASLVLGGLAVWQRWTEAGGGLVESWMAAGRHGGGMGYGHPGAWLACGVLGLLVLGALAFSAARRHGTMAGEVRHGFPDPMADLAEAYAQGTLTRDQYLERKAVLEEAK